METEQLAYVVITPVRNEAEFIEATIRSMTAQTALPAEWVIVNDGSTDATADIVARYAAEYPWIRLCHREDRGARQRGKGVVETFYVGFNALTAQTYDIVVKLDGDLTFEPGYFAALLAEFGANPQLGIAGGGLYEKHDGQTWVLSSYKDEVRGAIKMYRRACFEAMGGLVPTMGWDGVDEWCAHALGWEVRSFRETRVYHHRFTGAATGALKSRVEEGEAAHYMGYHPLFMLARAIRCMGKAPYLTGGLAMLQGYLMAGLRRRPRYPNPAILRYIRQTQWQKLKGLLAGKSIHEY